MRGAAPRAIQELARHRDFGTTQRYMHLSPATRNDAIRLLEQGLSTVNCGEIRVTEDPAIENVNG